MNPTLERDLERLIDRAFEYAFPLHAIATTRHRAVQDTSNPRRHDPNTWQHERHLADHTTRWITTPNNDTLYSNAWVDLSQGPIKLRAGPMPAGRYWSVALIDAFGNHVAMLGTRNHGTGPAEVMIAGPSQRGRTWDKPTINAPGQDVWLFARCLVDDGRDLTKTHEMQNLLQLEPLQEEACKNRISPGPLTDTSLFLAVVNEALERNRPAPGEEELLSAWSRIGIRPGARNAWQELNPTVRALWKDRIEVGIKNLQQAGMRGRREIAGWITAGPEIGNFGSNYALRASVALGGLGALEPAEAMYFVRFHDDQGRLLDGGNGLKLTVGPCGIPTDGFWSLSMYEPVAGQRFFTENPLARYAIGNRTSGLIYNADGSLDIALTHRPPEQPKLLANWLPAPAGAFQISLRCYLPKKDLLELRAPMPRISPSNS
jgi:hypothetical protein